MSPSLSLGRRPDRLSGVRIVEAGAEGPFDAVVERLCDEAHARGVAEGIALAQSQTAQSVEQAFGRAVDDLNGRAEAAEAAVAATAVELAVSIAGHLVRAEVEAGRHDIERIVRETLHAGSVGRAECVVHIHPDDAAALAGVTFRTGTRIEADVGVARGEVQVETQNGLLVRDFEEVFKEIRRRMLTSLNEAS